MNQAEKIIGSEMLHAQLGKVEVLGKTEKSRTQVEVKVLEKGPGWNLLRQKYTGVRIKTGWYRGENRQCGEVFKTHINQLKPLPDER